MRASFHCTSLSGHLRLGPFCFVWRNAVPKDAPVYISGHERLYDSFGETTITWGVKTIRLH